MKLIAAVLLVAVSGCAALAALRALDRRADRAEWERLAALQPQAPERFDPAGIASLPEPARRYFAYTIEPGAPLLPVAVIEMTGRFSLGSREDPRYQPIEARQILAPPEGFVWAMRSRAG
ncbi:MAG: DUF6544 family protein, partial [Halieaceae bacterium]|nr:DUF6544 family protein [Halieaceae bacterium]